MNLGTRHKLAHLEIAGNKYFTAAALRRRMYVLPATAIRYRHGRYGREYLDQDVNSIRDLYRSNGFRDVRGGSPHAGSVSRQAWTARGVY